MNRENIYFLLISCVLQGELLRYREHEDRGREEEERAGSSDAMWVWPAEETREWWEESQGEGGGAEDSFHSAMGYGVVTPGPEVRVIRG